MRVLTFGWDFPPAKNGGLGVACYGLTRELAQSGVEVIFVLPRTQPVLGYARFIFADVERLVTLRPVDSALVPYRASHSQMAMYDEHGQLRLTGRSVLDEVHRFAEKAAAIARAEQFDIIHAHDWSSYVAGLAAKRVSGKPLILHVHATSYDQAGGDNVDPDIFRIERDAFAAADAVVAVSHYTRNIITQKHGADPQKVSVIHNGCDPVAEPVEYRPTLQELKKQGKKIVLYHGRITIQKGVDYFVRAAKRVLDVNPDVVFVISGWGDMSQQIMQQVGQLGISRNVIFAGSLWDEERDRMYQTADLVVMPSVSEPFGLVPLEALQMGTASLISKQSGVGEVLTHVLKVDFWDTEDMANKIAAALKYDAMNRQLVSEGRRELSRLSWSAAASKLYQLYRRFLQWAIP